MLDAAGADVDSAVVSYRPAAGEERSLPVIRAKAPALYEAAPWRTFRWHYGQRHYSGSWWSATERRHVIYESRLELSVLQLADFDTSVRRIVAQPFALRAEVNGKTNRHVPDYLWETDDGPVVVDVVRAERLDHPRIKLLCAWTREVIESRGWCYDVFSEPPPVQLGNVRFLAGYRREWLINQAILDQIRCCATELVGLTIGEAERRIADHAQPLVRSAMMHLLWCHEFTVDLIRPLSRSTVLEASR